jgi:hypothetical protein
LDVRRHLRLLPEDEQFLNEYGRPWETIVDGSQWVLIHEFPTFGPYNHPRVTVAVRLETGYPNTELNMVYVHPQMARQDGRPIGATQVNQTIDNKVFQRWSRHRTARNPWRPGEDGIASHVCLIEDWFQREFEK